MIDGKHRLCYLMIKCESGKFIFLVLNINISTTKYEILCLDGACISDITPNTHECKIVAAYFCLNVLQRPHFKMFILCTH